jgi:hypothetical protein
VRGASKFLNWLTPAMGGALLMLIYLKRIEGMRELQDLQDGVFATLLLTLAVKFLVDKKLQANPNG